MKAGLVALLCVCSLGLAANKPNFSGTWVLDKDKSFSNPTGLDQTMSVTHAGDQIKLDAQVKTARGEQTINETYSLDGKETEFTPQGQGQNPAGKGKREAHWLPNDRGIVISEEVTTDSPNGPVFNRTMRKWTLSPDGKVLTVDYYFDSPRGSFEAKRVFVKR